MSIIKYAQIIWDYHHMNHTLQKSDCIVVQGSHDTRVAERGAELFLEGWAPLLICSGGLGRLTEGLWDRPEAEIFADIAVHMGVPEDKIIIENKSTNTGENVLFTRTLLEEKKITSNRFIIVHKPYMERRAYATFEKVWPGKEVIVTSPQMDFIEYCRGYKDGSIAMDDIICIMVGDLQRIRVYPDKGFQIFQEIPDTVWDAFEHLVESGYTKYLISNR